MVIICGTPDKRDLLYDGIASCPVMARSNIRRMLCAKDRIHYGLRVTFPCWRFKPILLPSENCLEALFYAIYRIAVLKITTLCHNRDLWKLDRSCKRLPFGTMLGNAMLYIFPCSYDTAYQKNDEWYFSQIRFGIILCSICKVVCRTYISHWIHRTHHICHPHMRITGWWWIFWQKPTVLYCILICNKAH